MNNFNIPRNSYSNRELNVWSLLSMIVHVQYLLEFTNMFAVNSVFQKEKE
jgi:hypothetical protein